MKTLVFQDETRTAIFVIESTLQSEEIQSALGIKSLSRSVEGSVVDAAYRLGAMTGTEYREYGFPLMVQGSVN